MEIFLQCIEFTAKIKRCCITALENTGGKTQVVKLFLCLEESNQNFSPAIQVKLGYSMYDVYRH